MRLRAHGGAKAGFTLIEVMAVLVILSILAAVLVPMLAGQAETVEVAAQEAYLKTLDVAIQSYEGDEGDFPPSSFTADQVADAGTNQGIEALVVAMWSQNRNGFGLSEDDLANTDGDKTSKQLTDRPVRELEELVDRWGNPIAYFHHADYGAEHLYRVYDEDLQDYDEVPVKAFVDARGNPYNRRTYQLISAGPDGVFGTDDDVTNFKR